MYLKVRHFSIQYEAAHILFDHNWLAVPVINKDISIFKNAQFINYAALLAGCGCGAGLCGIFIIFAFFWMPFLWSIVCGFLSPFLVSALAVAVVALYCISHRY